MKISLRGWQELIKPREELLFNCSEFSICNDEWVEFPIGMAYPFVNYEGPLEPIQKGSHERLVLCAITPTNDNRRRPNAPNRFSILQTLNEKGVQNFHIPSQYYFQELPNYKFIISPEGNGVDCHRHYEALLAGCIPIVEDHPGIRRKYEGCPILYTKDYSEISEEYLNRIWEEYYDRTWDFSRLFLSYYDEVTQEEIKKNGNYWGQRLCQKSYY